MTSSSSCPLFAKKKTFFPQTDGEREEEDARDRGEEREGERKERGSLPFCGMLQRSKVLVSLSFPTAPFLLFFPPISFSLTEETSACRERRGCSSEEEEEEGDEREGGRRD